MEMVATASSAVTAVVPDIEAPSIPILISPTDESILTDSTPTFVWYGSTDNVGIDHYDLWVNGVVKQAGITPIDQDTTLYTLVVNETDNTYSLTIKQGLSDGDYTWNIIAVDAADNSTTSAIWDFTIDTLAPSLSITKIEDDAVLITTQDSQTLPTAPIEVKHHDPLISGLGEAGATLTIILTIPNQSTVTQTVVLGSNGVWSFQFPDLEKNVLVSLTLIIEDAAGHTNVLSQIQFVYKPSTEVVATPTPKTLVFLPALTPPATGSPPPSGQTPLQPFITLFNRSQINLVIERGRDRVTHITAEPPPFWQWLSPIVLMAPTLITIFILLHKYGNFPDLTTLRLIWWWFGWRRKHRPDGEVHDRASLNKLWLIPIQATDLITGKVSIVSVTDRLGSFLLPKLDNSVFLLEPKWSGLHFPSLGKRPQSLPWHRFYLGEAVTYDKELPWPYLHIPVEQLVRQPKWQAVIIQATEWRGPMVLFQTLLLFILWLLYPSLITSPPFILSVLLGLFRVFHRNKSIVTNKTSVG